MFPPELILVFHLILVRLACLQSAGIFSYLIGYFNLGFVRTSGYFMLLAKLLTKQWRICRRSWFAWGGPLENDIGLGEPYR